MNKSINKKVSFYNVIKTVSDSIDLMSEEITGHHKLVAYISLRIGKELELENNQLRKLVFSSLIHDIGILYFDKKIDDILRNRTNEEHAYVGYALLEDYFPFKGYSDILKNHHKDWNQIENNSINYLSNIINLADITAFIIDGKESNILANKNIIMEEVHSYCKNKINQNIIKSLEGLIKQESFWLDTVNNNIREKILEEYICENLDIYLNLEQVLSISEIVSHIIDFRSPFTANHSKGVATIASQIASDIGFSAENIKIMKIAGHFHDIGKMSWPLNIINKPGQLSKSEWALVKSHTYYSYYVLENIKEIPQLKEWAAYHHEAIDGSGYPFKLDAQKLSMGSKIMTAADIFTALGEDRPYRKGFGKEKIIEILSNKAQNNKIESGITNLIIENFDRYNELRNEEQIKTINDYKLFKERTFDEIADIYYHYA